MPMRFRTVSIPGGVANAGSETILDWAQKSPTSISLQSLWKAGKAPSEDSGKQRLLNAKFLTHELRVRTAQRALELKSLPFKLSEKKPIMKVIDYYHRIFEGLDALKTPETLEDDAEFVTALQTIVLSNHEDVIQNMALGVRALRREMGPAYGGLANRNTLDMHLNRFFISRIGLRFLIEHHIESREARKGYSGIIASACSPLAVVRRAAEDCAYTARYHYGDAPHVDVIGDPEMTFTYVPYHLHYIVSELLKNSMRATLERHGQKEDGDLPDITVVIARGENDITVKVGDRGGGIPHREVKKCWTYCYSTADPPPLEGEEGHEESFQDDRGTVGALAGYGFGLPLSRLYSRYFGGDLSIMSMEGYGTDAYVHLNRLGSDCENLPLRVLNSPASRDSTLTPWGE